MAAPMRARDLLESDRLHQAASVLGAVPVAPTSTSGGAATSASTPSSSGACWLQSRRRTFSGASAAGFGSPGHAGEHRRSDPVAVAPRRRRDPARGRNRPSLLPAARRPRADVDRDPAGAPPEKIDAWRHRALTLVSLAALLVVLVGLHRLRRVSARAGADAHQFRRLHHPQHPWDGDRRTPYTSGQTITISGTANPVMNNANLVAEHGARPDDRRPHRQLLLRGVHRPGWPRRQPANHVERLRGGDRRLDVVEDERRLVHRPVVPGLRPARPGHARPCHHDRDL